MAKILAFAGSARKDSLNKKLLKIVAAGAEAVGAHLTLVDLADFDMPLFNQDLETEQGMPDRAVGWTNQLSNFSNKDNCAGAHNERMQTDLALATCALCR